MRTVCTRVGLAGLSVRSPHVYRDPSVCSGTAAAAAASPGRNGFGIEQEFQAQSDEIKSSNVYMAAIL